MNINPMAFVDNLSYMLVGMISIFAVIGVVILVTMFLNALFSKNKKN